MTASVWPFIPFVALRGAQIFFAIVTLGLSGYVGSLTEGFWSPWFTLVTSLFTLIGVGFFLVTFFIAPAFTAPLFTLGADAFLWLFWLISLAGWADQFQGVLQYTGSCGGNNACGSVKGGMAMIVFEFLLFFATLGLSGWYFYRERRGKPTGTFNPEGGQVSAGAIGAPPTPAPPPAAYNQQQAYPLTQQQQPQYTPSGGEYNGQQQQQQQPVAYPNEGQYQYGQQQQTYPAMPATGGYQQPK